MTAPVVVGADGSTPSQPALLWAAQAAMARDLPLVILHAAPKESATEGAQILQEAKALVHDRFPGLECTTVIAHESPAEALIDASATASLAVVGNRGHGGFHDLLLGSTSLHTAMHAHCPVAVVRPSVPGKGRDRIVVGVDATPHSHAALDLAFTEARRMGRAVTAVHAYISAITAYPTGLMPQIPDLEADRARAKELLDGELLPWLARYPDIDVEVEVAQGSASSVLVQRSLGANLVVVGSRGRGGFTGLLFGSASHALIHHAGCPVLIAHRKHSDSNE